MSARQQGRRAEAASLDARQASAEAVAAARATREAMNAPATPPVESAPLPVQTRQVTVVSRMPGYPSTERQVVLTEGPPD